MRTVFTQSVYVEDVRDPFYFSTRPGFGAELPSLGEPVAIYSEKTHNLLAFGQITAQGEPYAECSTVTLTQRFL